MSAPAKTGRMQGKFAPGESGNPAGKRRGTRNATTLAVEALLDGEAEALTRRAIELALKGDTIALRMCLDRIAPPRKGRAVTLAFPASLKTPNDLAEAQASILTAMGSGEITTDEAADAAKVIEAVGAAIERRELEQRIAALEERGTRE